MSWIDQVNKKMEITTGDGKKYNPEWMNPNKSVEYNTKEFNFPGVKGTLVDRRLAKGAKFDLELFFQGDDNLDVARAFEISASDPRHWTIDHPIYGLINVQPSSLKFDNKSNGTTIVTGTVTETITNTNPSPLLIPEDKIAEDAEFYNAEVAENFGVNTTPKSSDIAKSKQEDAVIYSGTSKKIEDADDGNAYFNGFNEAQAAMTNATTDAAQAMRKTQVYLEAPARFKQSVRSRVNMLTSAFDNLQNSVVGTNKKISKNTKLFFEAKAGNVVSAIALATSIIFDEDYTNRNEVVEQVEKLLFTFSTYLQILDDLQTGSGGDKNDFIPSAQGIIQLNNLVTFSAANLFKIGLSAKQERFYFVPDDTDLISLAHQLYGLENGDASIDELIKNNGFGMDAYLLIKKGTLVKYYI